MLAGIVFAHIAFGAELIEVNGELAFENSHGGWIVIDSSGGSQSSGNNAWRGHEIVGERVVQVALARGLSMKVDLEGSVRGEDTWSSKTS